VLWNVNSSLSNFPWNTIYIADRCDLHFTLLGECNYLHRQEEELNGIGFKSIPYLIIHIGLLQSCQGNCHGRLEGESHIASLLGRSTRHTTLMATLLCV